MITVLNFGAELLFSVGLFILSIFKISYTENANHKDVILSPET
jgi:hypothetical protein